MVLLKFLDRLIFRRLRFVRLPFLLIAFSIFFMSYSWIYADSSQKIFDQANRFYQEGDYTKAVNLYEDLLLQGASASLYYNLGNAYASLKKYPQAVLFYQKTRFIDPHFPGLKKNLKIIYKHLNQIYPESTLDALTNWFSAVAWNWIWGISFWLMVICLVLPPILNRKKVIFKKFFLICAFFLLLATLALFRWDLHQRKGIVLKDNTKFYIAPSLNSPVKNYLASMQLAVVDAQKGDFFKIRSSKNSLGWVHRDFFAPFRSSSKK